jgi:hypothetical protein
LEDDGATFQVELADELRQADCMMAAHVRNYERAQAVLAS